MRDEAVLIQLESMTYGGWPFRLSAVDDIHLGHKGRQGRRLLCDDFPISPAGGLLERFADVADFLKAIASSVTLHTMTEKTHGLQVAGLRGAGECGGIFPSIFKETGDQVFEIGID